MIICCVCNFVPSDRFLRLKRVDGSGDAILCCECVLLVYNIEKNRRETAPADGQEMNIPHETDA